MMYEVFTMDQETLQSPNTSVKHKKHGFQFSVMFEALKNPWFRCGFR